MSSFIYIVVLSKNRLFVDSLEKKEDCTDYVYSPISFLDSANKATKSLPTLLRFEVNIYVA